MAEPRRNTLNLTRQTRGMSLRLKLSLGLILIIGVMFAGLNAFNILTSRNRQRAEAILQKALAQRSAQAAAN